MLLIRKILLVYFMIYWVGQKPCILIYHKNIACLPPHLVNTNQDVFQSVESGMDEDGEGQEEGNDEDERKEEPSIERSHLGLVRLYYAAKPKTLKQENMELSWEVTLYLSRATHNMVRDDMNAAMQGNVLIKLQIGACNININMY